MVSLGIGLAAPEVDATDLAAGTVDEVFGRIKITDRRTNSTRTFDTPEFVQDFYRLSRMTG